MERIDFGANCPKGNEADELSKRLLESIKNLSLENETGFLLSGGIDSSTLVALASQNLGKKVRTFTAAFPGSDLDESSYAEIVAKANNCENEIVELGGNSFINDLPEIVWHLDEPYLDFSAIPVYHLFKEIKKRTSVIISGDGPDHLFGRYYPLAAKRYAANRAGFFNGIFKKIPVTFLNKIARVSNCSLQRTYNEIFLMPNWGIENTGTMMDLFSPEIEKISTTDDRFNNYFNDMFSNFKENSFENVFSSISYIDFYIDGSFGVFSKVGKMAAANGIVVREPYLERGVSDFIAGLPLRYKARGSWIDLLSSKAKAKYLLKHELGSKILPAEIVNKKKGGFTPPLKNWLKEKICSLPIDRLLCATLSHDGYFNPSYLEKIISEHREGKKDWSTVIFMLLSFDLWIRMVIEDDYKNFPGWTLGEIYK